MSQDQSLELFKAAFYADLNVLQKLIVSEADMQIKLPLPDGDYKLFWNKSYLEIDVLDILNWAAFGFYEYIDEERICHRMYDAQGDQVLNDCINPSEYYDEVMYCIVWLCDKFGINNFQIKDYSKYRLLRHFLFDDENWLDENEMNEAIISGFKELDLNLINESEKGNGISSYNLIKKGANYKIDPVDFTDNSHIIDILGSDMSFNRLRLTSILCHKETFGKEDAYEMLPSVYQVGVSNYILDIVMTE